MPITRRLAGRTTFSASTVNVEDVALLQSLLYLLRLRWAKTMQNPAMAVSIQQGAVRVIATDPTPEPSWLMQKPRRAKDVETLRPMRYTRSPSAIAA